MHFLPLILSSLFYLFMFSLKFSETIFTMRTYRRNSFNGKFTTVVDIMGLSAALTVNFIQRVTMLYIGYFGMKILKHSSFTLWSKSGKPNFTTGFFKTFHNIKIYNFVSFIYIYLCSTNLSPS